MSALTPTSAQVENAFDSAIHSPVLLAPIAALVAAGVGALLAQGVIAAGWFTSGVAETDLPSVAGAGVLLWVVSHAVPWQMAGVSITLLPWGLVLIPLLLTRLAGRWLSFASRTHQAWRWWTSWLLGLGTYALAVAGATVLIEIPTVHVSTLRALLMGALISGVGLWWGMRAYAPKLGLDDWIPGWVRTVMRSAWVAVGTLIGISAIVLAAVAIGHFDDMMQVGTALGAGPWGGAVVTVVQMAYVPTMVMWTLSYLIGAGVALGPDLVMTPFLATTEGMDLPPVPVLALLPTSSIALAWALPVIGVLAGLVSGVFIARGAEREPRLMRTAMVVLSSALAGIVLALAASLTQGSWGLEKLSSWGPLAQLTGSLVFVTVVVGALASALTVRTEARIFSRKRDTAPHLVVVESGVNVSDLGLVHTEEEVDSVQESDDQPLEGENDSRQ